MHIKGGKGRVDVEDTLGIVDVEGTLRRVDVGNMGIVDIELVGTFSCGYPLLYSRRVSDARDGVVVSITVSVRVAFNCA